jgi:hypothetical protein
MIKDTLRPFLAVAAFVVGLVTVSFGQAQAIFTVEILLERSRRPMLSKIFRILR